MNEQAKRILKRGGFFAMAVVILDLFLLQFPLFDWPILGLVFILAAALLMNSVAGSLSRQRQQITSNVEERDELRDLTHVVDSAVFGREELSMKMLSDQLKSLALVAVASRTKLSRVEIQKLADNAPESLRAIIHDNEIMKFLATGQLGKSRIDEKGLEEALSKIEDWSH